MNPRFFHSMALLVLAATAIGAGSASATEAGIGIVGISSRIEAGKVAHIGVLPAPISSRCVVVLEAGTYVGTPRLIDTKKALLFKWRVPLTAPRRKTPVVVSCRGAGTLRTHITILPPG